MPEIGVEQDGGVAPQGQHLVETAQGGDALEDLTEMGGGEPLGVVGGQGHGLDLTIGKGQRHGDIVGAAVGAELLEDGELELLLVDVEALANPAQALADVAHRAVEIGRVPQRAVRRIAFGDAIDIPEPGEALTGELGVQGPDADVEAPQRHADRKQTRGELFGQLGRRLAQPGLAQQPVDQRAARNLRAFGFGQRPFGQHLPDHLGVEGAVAGHGTRLL